MDSEHKKTAPGGAVFVVGLGPGDPESLTPRADRALRECGLIVGYSGYTGPLRPRYPDKEYSSTGMTASNYQYIVVKGHYLIVHILCKIKENLLPLQIIDFDIYK